MVPPREAVALAMMAYAGGFTDILKAGAGAASLVAIANTQLEQSGYRLVPVARN